MGNLHKKTLTLLKERDPALKLEQIVVDTGLTFYWLKSFLKGTYSDPGVNKVEKLHDYLVSKSGCKAELDRLVDKFLCWPLPESVCSDLCVTEHGMKHRLGTSLLTADEARQMLEYLFKEES